jgi:AraC-like DNA-binding protein
MTREPDLPAAPPRPGTLDIATPAFRLMKTPAPAHLAGLVNDFALYREFSANPIRQTETASLVVPLLIGFADPFEMALGREPRADEGFQSFTAGLTLKPVMIRSAGGSSCLEVTLTPLGARRFFRMPMSELTERMIRLEDVEDRSLTELRQRLGNERDWMRRLAIAEEFVTRRLLGGTAPSPAVAWAYGTILKYRGGIAVSRIAEKLDWSRKHLAQRFREEVGLGPKAVSRIVRFQAAQELARTGDDWAGVAAECGYADQAHLAREFRELAGATPSDWLARAA